MGILSTNHSGGLSPRQGAFVNTMPNRHIEIELVASGEYKGKGLASWSEHF